MPQEQPWEMSADGQPAQHPRKQASQRPRTTAMHPIVIYVMFKTRMELDREAERRRLARPDMPPVLPAPADRRPPTKKWRAAMSIHPWIAAPSGDRGQPNRIGDIGFPHAVAESPVRPGGR
jgi:hypothetical protein